MLIPPKRDFFFLLKLSKSKQSLKEKLTLLSALGSRFLKDFSSLLCSTFSLFLRNFLVSPSLSKNQTKKKTQASFPCFETRGDTQEPSKKINPKPLFFNHRNSLTLIMLKQLLRPLPLSACSLFLK